MITQRTDEVILGDDDEPHHTYTGVCSRCGDPWRPSGLLRVAYV